MGKLKRLAKKLLAYAGRGFHVPSMNWNDTFESLFERCAADYKAGNFDYNKDYSAEDLALLASVGYKRRELFDFIEDYVDGGVPTPSTALLVAAVRRDYFLVEQGGNASDKEINRDDLPSRDEELDGISYLPRILVKARAKLRGQLDPDTMFSCGGDRNFLSKHGNIAPADFLRHVWASGGNDSKVVAWLKSL
tara:strand:+ start:5603 stop:6181 length:579 start_codon:yes stop_codon:yes gene_type:complete